MISATINMPKINAGTPAPDGAGFALYALDSITKGARSYDNAIVSLTTESFLPEEAEALLQEARRYKVCRKVVKSYDVYSTYNVEPGEDPAAYTYYDIQYENLVVKDRKLFGVLFCQGAISAIFPIEDLKESYGKSWSATRERVYAQPLDYFIDTQISVTLVQNKDL